MCGQDTVDQYWPVNANRFILYSRSGYTDPTAKTFKTAQAKLNADAWGTWAPPESTVRGFFQMWNFIGDEGNVFEMRLRNRNGRKSVGDKKSMGFNTIHRFPHASRLLPVDIVAGAQDIVKEMGGGETWLSSTSIAMISSLDSDYMLGNEDKLTDEFEPLSGHHVDALTSMCALPLDEVPENAGIPTGDEQDPGFWSSIQDISGIT